MSFRRILMALLLASIFTVALARETEPVLNLDDELQRTAGEECYVVSPEKVNDLLYYTFFEHIVVHSNLEKSRCIVLNDLPFTGYYKVSVIAMYSKDEPGEDMEEYQLVVDDVAVGDIVPDQNNPDVEPTGEIVPDDDIHSPKDGYVYVRNDHGYVFIDKEHSILQFKTGGQFVGGGRHNSIDFFAVLVTPPPHIIEEPEFTAGNTNIIEWKPLTDGVLAQDVYHFDNTGLAKAPGRSPVQLTSSTQGTEYTAKFEGLLDGHQYGYYVEALLENGQSVRSSTTYSTQDASPPSAVTIGSITSFANRIVYLKWNAATDAGSGVDHYLIVRSEDNGQSKIAVVDTVWATELCDDAGDFDYCIEDEIADVAVPNKVFTYQINAVDEMGNVSNGVASEIVIEVPTPELSTNPELVGGLFYKGAVIKLVADVSRLTQPESHKIKFQAARDNESFFDNQAGVGRHFFETDWLELASGDTLVEQEIDLTNNGDNDLNFINGHLYYCRVQLVDLQGNFSAWSDVLVVKPDCFAPNDISMLSVNPMTDSTNIDGWMHIAWSGASDLVSGISQYYVYRKTSKADSFSCIAKTNDMFYQDKFDSINWNGSVTYRIGSEDKVGNIRTADLSQYEASAKSQSAPVFSIVSGSIAEDDTIKSTTMRKIYVLCELRNFEDPGSVKIIAKVNDVERDRVAESGFGPNTYKIVLPDSFGLYTISVKALFPTKAVSIWSNEDQILFKDPNAPVAKPLVKEPEKMMSANFPNPFNPSTNITYILTNDSHVKVEIYNVQGRRIKSLTDDFQAKGSHSVLWNGDNEAGHAVSSGMYYYKIEFEDENLNKESIIKRMLLIK